MNIQYLGFKDIYDNKDCYSHETVLFAINGKCYAIGMFKSTKGTMEPFILEKENATWWTIMLHPVCTIREVIANIPYDHYIQALLYNNEVALYIREKGLIC